MLKAGRVYRLFATAFCFAVFGAAGLSVGLLLLPATVLTPRRFRQRGTRWLVRTFFRFFIWLMATVRVLTYEFVGAEALSAPGLIVVANHPTLIDVIFLISRMPSATCVVRPGLLRNVFTRGPMTAAGYIGADDGPSLVDACVEAIRAGERLVIFPEGTRSRRGQPLSLRRGAAHIALRHGQGLLPVDIRCTPLTLGKGEPWYRIPPQRPHFSIRVGSVMALEPFGTDESKAARALTECLTHRWSTLWSGASW